MITDFGSQRKPFPLVVQLFKYGGLGSAAGPIQWLYCPPLEIEFSGWQRLAKVSNLRKDSKLKDMILEARVCYVAVRAVLPIMLTCAAPIAIGSLPISGLTTQVFGALDM